MGVMPIRRLLLTMSGPMMVSMLIQALYNVVDSMFVSYISEDALTAVSLAYPMQNLMIAVATGTGVGVNALLSRNLGEKNFAMANRAAGNAIFLGLVSFAVFALVGAVGVPAVLHRPGGRPGDHRLRGGLPVHHHDPLHRLLRPGPPVPAAPVHGEDLLQHDHPAGGGGG